MGFFDNLDPILQDTLRSTGDMMIQNPNASFQDILGFGAGSYLGNRMFGNYGSNGMSEQRLNDYVNSPQAINKTFGDLVGMNKPTTAGIGSNLTTLNPNNINRSQLATKLFSPIDWRGINRG